MKALKVFLDIAAVSISLASIVFMGIVFYVEAILGKGMLYIEPNRYMAFTELLLTIFGFAVVLGLYVLRLAK